MAIVINITIKWLENGSSKLENTHFHKKTKHAILDNNCSNSWKYLHSKKWTLESWPILILTDNNLVRSWKNLIKSWTETLLMLCNKTCLKEFFLLKYVLYVCIYISQFDHTQKIENIYQKSKQYVKEWIKTKESLTCL